MMTSLGLDDDSVQKLANRIPLGRLGTPTDFGSACLFLASDASSWMTGRTLPLSGGR